MRSPSGLLSLREGAVAECHEREAQQLLASGALGDAHRTELHFGLAHYYRTGDGSSSGSAALVTTGEVDMAIGGDQGGSIRMPAGWCGIYGMNPPSARRRCGHCWSSSI